MINAPSPGGDAAALLQGRPLQTERSAASAGQLVAGLLAQLGFTRAGKSLPSRSRPDEKCRRGPGLIGRHRNSDLIFDSSGVQNPFRRGLAVTPAPDPQASWGRKRCVGLSVTPCPGAEKTCRSRSSLQLQCLDIVHVCSFS